LCSRDSFGHRHGHDPEAGETGTFNAELFGLVPCPAQPPCLLSAPDQVLPLLRQRQGEWRQRYQLQRIGLFGFTARNEATAQSDVDVWVELDPLTPYATVHLKQELEELLQRPVDLMRMRERMNPALRQAILREGISA